MNLELILHRVYGSPDWQKLWNWSLGKLEGTKLYYNMGTKDFIYREYGSHYQRFFILMKELMHKQIDLPLLKNITSHYPYSGVIALSLTP